MGNVRVRSLTRGDLAASSRGDTEGRLKGEESAVWRWSQRKSQCDGAGSKAAPRV